MERDGEGTYDMFGAFSKETDLCHDCLVVTDMYSAESSYSIILDAPHEKHSMGAFCFPNFSRYCQAALRNFYGTMLSARSHQQLLDPEKLLKEENFIINSHIPLNEDVKRGICIVPFNSLKDIGGDKESILKMRRDVDIGNQKVYIDVKSAYLNLRVSEKGMTGTGKISISYDYHEEKYRKGVINVTSREFKVSEIFKHS